MGITSVKQRQEIRNKQLNTFVTFFTKPKLPKLIFNPGFICDFFFQEIERLLSRAFDYSDFTKKISNFWSLKVLDMNLANKIKNRKAKKSVKVCLLF